VGGELVMADACAVDHGLLFWAPVVLGSGGKPLSGADLGGAPSITDQGGTALAFLSPDGAWTQTSVATRYTAIGGFALSGPLGCTSEGVVVEGRDMSTPLSKPRYVAVEMDADGTATELQLPSVVTESSEVFMNFTNQPIALAQGKKVIVYTSDGGQPACTIDTDGHPSGYLSILPSNDAILQSHGGGGDQLETYDLVECIR
jgi:hypothetical protein